MQMLFIIKNLSKVLVYGLTELLSDEVKALPNLIIIRFL